MGAIGAILAVPLTMMILIVLDSFDATRWVVVLMRPSSSTQEPEIQEATSKLKGVWDKLSYPLRGKDEESGEGG